MGIRDFRFRRDKNIETGRLVVFSSLSQIYFKLRSGKKKCEHVEYEVKILRTNDVCKETRNYLPSAAVRL